MELSMKSSMAVALSVLLLSGCGREDGDHGSKTQIELLLKDGGSVILVCPVHDSAPWGSHGRECYMTNSPTVITNEADDKL